MGGQGGGTPPAMGGGYAPEKVKRVEDLVITLCSNVSWKFDFDQIQLAKMI